MVRYVKICKISKNKKCCLQITYQIRYIAIHTNSHIYSRQLPEKCKNYSLRKILSKTLTLSSPHSAALKVITGNQLFFTPHGTQNCALCTISHRVHVLPTQSQHRLPYRTLHDLSYSSSWTRASLANRKMISTIFMLSLLPIQHTIKEIHTHS